MESINQLLPDWLKSDILGFSNWQWLGLFLGLFVGLFLKSAGEWLIKVSIKKFSRQGEQSYANLFLRCLEAPGGLVFATAFWFVSIKSLGFTGTTLNILTALIKVSLGFSLVWVAYKLTDVFQAWLQKLASRTDNNLSVQLVPLITKTVRLFVLIFGTLVVVQNLGFNVMSLMAGLGLGGLAFALAAKDTAANLFGSIMILLDRPFKIGDYIISNGVEGTVEEIGFRSTRIRTLYDSLISVPNSVMVVSNIDNMGRRRYRRSNFELGLTYDTSPEKIEQFVAGIKKILATYTTVLQDETKTHVAFNSYGNFSLNILVQFFVYSDTLALELNERHKVLLDIMKLAKRIPVEFAFPTQTLHLAEKRQ